jgi:hypothetical protein
MRAVTGRGFRVGVGATALVVAVAGYAVGRAATAPDPIPRNDRPTVDGERAIETLSHGLYRNFEGAITQAEADCAGRATARAVGTQRLIDLGLGGFNPYGGFSYAELTEDEGQAYVEAFLGCIPDDRIAGYRASILDQNTELDSGSATCVADAELEAVGAGRLRELLVALNARPGAALADVATDGDEQAALADVAAGCGVEEVPTATGT